MFHNLRSLGQDYTASEVGADGGFVGLLLRNIYEDHIGCYPRPDDPVFNTDLAPPLSTSGVELATELSTTDGV